MTRFRGLNWRVTYDKVAPILVMFCLVASLFASVGVFVQNRVSQHEQEARLADNAKLLNCFDEFATALSGGLPPVRAATASTNEALAEALTGLQEGLIKVGTDSFQPADLSHIIALFDAYQKSNDHLVKVRSENPYPDAPSVFCDAA